MYNLNMARQLDKRRLDKFLKVSVIVSTFVFLVIFGLVFTDWSSYYGECEGRGKSTSFRNCRDWERKLEAKEDNMKKYFWLMVLPPVFYFGGKRVVNYVAPVVEDEPKNENA